MSQLMTSGDATAFVQYFRRWHALDLLRGAAFIAVLLLVWISLKPFADLSDVRVGDNTTGNETTTYAAFGLLTMLTVVLAMRDNRRAIASLLSPGLVLLGGWILVSVFISLEPATSMRRLVLTLGVIALAATVMLLPKSPNELVRWFSVAALVLLATCYFGVLLAPHVSIHQPTDVAEPALAGDWRGTFGHKNMAAGVMVTLLFFAIYIIRSGALLSGMAIFGMASLFLFNSASKSSLSLCFVVLLVTSMTSIVRSFWARALLLLVPLVILNLLSVGTVISPELAGLAKTLPIDSTFTGRTDIWTFAVQAVQARLLTGYGFAAFWDGSAIQNLPDHIWAEIASHSHNGYLDVALTMGLPGLALLLWVFAIGPLKNFHAADRGGNNGPLAMALLRIWLFGLYLSSLESFFLERADALWFMFLVAVFGLHYLARFRVSE